MRLPNTSSSRRIVANGDTRTLGKRPAFAGLDRTAELMSQPGEDDDPRRTIEMPAIVGHLLFEEVQIEIIQADPPARPKAPSFPIPM